jgi:poly-beta-1,6-N-acetyl-D-glucosamine synthase
MFGALESRAVRSLFVGSIALIGYVFAGYPAMVAALAKLRPRPVRADPAHTPRVTLVIAAHNEADVIEDKLRNVEALDYPRDRLEVIVAADGSDDETPELAARFDGVVVLHRPERLGKLAAINRAVEASSGDVLVFSDANNMYAPDALRELVAPLTDDTVGLVGGRKVIDSGTGRALDQAEGLYWRYESQIKRWESAIGSVIGAPGEILAFRREAYRTPEPGMLTEDFVQAMLVAADGWRVIYAPGARSVERASATIEDEAVRRSRLIVGRSQALLRLLPGLVRRHPMLAWQLVSHKGLRPAVPWALAGAAVSNAALAGRGRVWRVLAAAQVLFYAAATVGWRQEAAGRRSRLTYLPYYFCRMNLATLRGLSDFARGRRQATWARVRRG